MKKQLLLTRMLLLVALLVGSVSAWATVPDNPKWVATAIGSISDNATVIILSSSNVALPSTTASSSPEKVSCTVTTTAGVTTITPPTGKTIQNLAWTFKKVVDNNKTYYKFYQEGSSTIRLYLTGTSSNTALRVGDASSSNDKFVMGSGGKLLKVSTASRYVGPYSSGSDWRTYDSETAKNYDGATLTFYVLQAAVETHKLTFSATNGSITAKDAEDATVVTNSDVEEGANLTITAVPAAGYKFVQWSKTGEGASIGNTTANPTTFTMGTTDATLTAEFDEDDTEYTITIDPSIENGSIIASANKALSGTEITLTPSADSGYRFVSWNVTDAGSNTITVTNNKFNMPGSNVTVSATFAKEYDITITPSENGEVTSDVAKAISGETVTLTITPAMNYSLNTISVKDADEGDVALSGTGNTRTFTMPAKAVTVTATFNIPKGSFANPYTVDEIIGSSISGNKYVRGYIVGDLTNKTYSVNTKGTFADSNLALAKTPSANDNTFDDRDDVIAIQLPDKNIIKVNNKMSTHSYLIGKEAIVYGSVEDYFGRKGVKSTKLILTNNVMTLKDFGESSASDIPGYSVDGNILYYTNSSVAGKNIIKETSDGTCSTTSAIKITEGDPFRVLSDVTVPSIENSRVIPASEDAYTWYEPYNYTLAAGNGTAYSFTGVSGTTLQFTAIGSTTLTANTPYLIVPTADVDASVATEVTLKATPATDATGATEGDWTFKGTYTGMTAAEAAAANVYGLNAGNKWLYFTGSEGFGMPPFRAYMVNASGHAKIMESILDTDTKEEQEVTAIELINKDGSENRIYTLDGKYVGTKSEVLSKGMYIVNGKKFIVK